MPENSSLSGFLPVLPETNTPPQTLEHCDVYIFDSRSLSVRSIVADLSSHLRELGVLVAFSGEFRPSVCIVVLSKDFADSADRLEELRRIHECELLDLIPIFFDVRPSEVRKVDQGVFQKAFERVSDQNGFQGWKLAFERTALISGWKFSDFQWNSRKLLKAVVQNVMKKVNSSSLQVAKYPVGLAEKSEKLERLLEAGVNSNRARVLSIVGMGGIGKTTLAKEFFRTIRTQFRAACFLEDVKGKVEKTGLERVQSLLLKDLVQIDHQIHSTNQGKYLLKKCLHSGAEVIIVLDNIDDFDHLNALWVPLESMNQNSIILITTRDRRLVECIPDSLTYEMEGLERKYARELFCWHAFLMPSPALGFDTVVERFVSYCDGLPLSLETLGGMLFGEELPAWEEKLKNISESLPGDIERQVRVSYDALDFSEKQIFLDIALFFIGEHKEMIIRIWNALGWFGSVGVQSLQQKCLIKLDNGHFQMHDQLRQMAEKIVDEEDIGNPGCRSRLWRPNDVMTVLSLQSGSENIGGISLTAKQVENERLGSLIVPRSEIIRNQYGALNSMWPLGSFAPMTELRLLILEDACIEGDFSLLSKKIMWLRWRRCPSGPLPVGLPVKSLRVLDLSAGKIIRLWSDNQQIPVHLEELHLQGCVSLRGFPKSIKFLSKLEKLILSDCLSLVDIPDGFCDIYSLKHVDLSGCRGLHALPKRLGNWKRLQYLDLSNCEKLETLPSSFGDLEKLEHLDLRGCSELSELSASFHNLKELRYLNLGFCSKLESRRDVTVGFKKLEFLCTMFCKEINFPAVATYQLCIKTLKISCSQLKVFPHCLGDLVNLEQLSLSDGIEVKTLDPFVFTRLNHLKVLTIAKFPLLEDLGSSLCHLGQLRSLCITVCGILHLPEEIGMLKCLKHLMVEHCSNLVRLPMTVKGLSSLATLSVNGCSNLQLDPGAFPNISSFVELSLGKCKVTNHFFQLLFQGGIALTILKMENMRLPAMEGIGSGSSNIASFSVLSCSNITSFEILRGISSLKIEDCPGLKKITVPVHNTSLQTLHLGNCKSLVDVCSIENLKYLKSLNINGCFELRTVAGLEKVNRLSELHLFLSDWYLLHRDHDNDWLKKTLNKVKLPLSTHLSAKVELEKCQLKFLSRFQKIHQYSPDSFKTKLHNSTGKSFCGAVICFTARHSRAEHNVSISNNSRNMYYQSVYLRIINGADEIEISQYNIPEHGHFFHISIFMDEFLVSEMSAPGAELVISSENKNKVYGAWIFLVPAHQKHLAGEVACNLIDDLTEHKSSVGDYVPRSQLNLKRLKDVLPKVLIYMDFRGIHALGITNYIIERTCMFNNVPVCAERISPFAWKKHQQTLFEGVDRFPHLDLELGNGCRNLVENPVGIGYEIRIIVWNSKISAGHSFSKLLFPPKGSLENYYTLDKITSSHTQSLSAFRERYCNTYNRRNHGGCGISSTP